MGSVMEEYVQITVRSREGRWKDIDIKVHAGQSWDYITEVLVENGLIGREEQRNYRSLRQNRFFSGELSSIQAGIYTGDIIEVGGH